MIDVHKVDVKVVIGSNYGDECKGLATHYFSQSAADLKKKCVNVLYNGGCQRGHTVELKDGTRHVFHHFGSGTFDHADTYFDKDFIVNPMFFVSEREELIGAYGANTLCYISPECRVSTPYDMIVNQIVELSRKDNKHGSCGYGIWETQKRYKESEFNLKYSELIALTDDELIEYLSGISHKYIGNKLESYKVKEVPEEYKLLIDSYGLLKHYVEDLRTMQRNAIVASFEEIAKSYDSIIFEGAQGLELDEGNIEALPHVTASKTGSFVPVIRTRNLQCDIEICYVTRSYFTRHGRGPLPTECSMRSINQNIEDRTNIHNQFQDSIRYGLFEKGVFLDRVFRDRKESVSIQPQLRSSLFVTHLNYTGDIAGDTTVDELKQFFDFLYLSKTRYAEDVDNW